MVTVLIIEDNSEIRESTAELLKLSGYEPLGAVDGVDGIKLAMAVKPDIILCDIMMPALNGYEVLKQLKSNPQTAAIPFVYVSASAERRDIKVATELGADGYVAKPFKLRQLTDAINHCLKV